MNNTLNRASWLRGLPLTARSATPSAMPSSAPTGRQVRSRRQTGMTSRVTSWHL